MLSADGASPESPKFRQIGVNPEKLTFSLISYFPYSKQHKPSGGERPGQVGTHRYVCMLYVVAILRSMVDYSVQDMVVYG